MRPISARTTMAGVRNGSQDPVRPPRRRESAPGARAPSADSEEEELVTSTGRAVRHWYVTGRVRRDLSFVAAPLSASCDEVCPEMALEMASWRTSDIAPHSGIRGRLFEALRLTSSWGQYGNDAVSAGSSNVEVSAGRPPPLAIACCTESDIAHCMNSQAQSCLLLSDGMT